MDVTRTQFGHTAVQPVKFDHRRAGCRTIGLDIALIILAAATWMEPSAWAQTPVLPPSAGAALERTFGATQGAWSLDSATIGPQSIVGRACTAGHACVDFRIAPPTPQCVGMAIAAGCLTATSADAQTTAGLVAVLRSFANPWRTTSPPRHAPVEPPSLLLALCIWLAAPTALAFAVALPLRRRRQAPGVTFLALGAVLWLALGVAGSLLGGFWLLWDGVAMGCLAALCWLVVLTRVSATRVALTLTSTVLGLLLLEGALRVLHVNQPGITVPLGPPWHLNGDVATAAAVREPGFCALWGPPNGDAQGCPAVEAIDLQPRAMLHIGDSMLEGSGVDRSRSLTVWLEKLAPGTSHLNTGLGNSSLDLQAAIARRWLARSSFRMVVLHVFAGNDLLEIGMPRMYCGDRSVLVTDKAGTRERCPEPIRDSSRFQEILRFSPPPFPLHWLASYSLVVRAVARQFLWASTASAGPNSPRAEALADYRSALEFLLSTTRANQIPVVAVMMPNRRSLRRTEFQHDAERLRDILKSEGIAVLETQAMVDEVVRTQGEQAVFLQRQDDPHLNEHGLELLGRWLSPQLESRCP